MLCGDLDRKEIQKRWDICKHSVSSLRVILLIFLTSASQILEYCSGCHRAKLLCNPRGSPLSHAHSLRAFFL